MKDKKIINFDDKRNAEIIPQSLLPKLMSEICDIAINDFNALYLEMLDEVDVNFLTLADQAESDQDQSLYFHSMTQIQNRRKEAETIFSERLARALTILLNTGQQSLLDPLQPNIEDSEKSRLKQIIDKANSANQLQLWQITQRFDILLSNVSLNLSNNPLNPLSICYIFVDTLTLFDLQIKAKLSFYDLFEHSLIEKIDTVYKKVNSHLSKNGVLPNLARFNPNQKPLIKENTTSDSMADFTADTKTDSGANLLEALTILRKDNPSLFNVYSSAAVAKVSALEIEQLVKALTKIQASKDVATDDLTNSTNIIRKHIKHALRSSGIDSRQLFDQKTDDVIACISLLFDFISNDKNLPKEFKTLIVRLQIPLLKVALMDTSFLTKSNHPARTLLNEIAQAGVGWSKGGGVGLKDKAEQVIDKIVNEFLDDTTLFIHSLLDFQSFTNQHKKRAFLIERRLQQAESGKAKVETAKKKSRQAIDDIVDGKILPDSISQLVHDDWLNVMLLTYLRNGEDSEAWKRNIQTVKDLINALSLSDNVTFESVSNQLSDIAENIKLGLDVVDYGEYESAQLFQDLQQLYERVQQGEKVIAEPSLNLVNSELIEILPALESEFFSEDEEINYSDIPLPTVEEMPVVLREKTEVLDDLNDSFKIIVESLQAGKWFELKLNEKVIRCKLTVIIASINKYVFVDYTGKKIAEYSKPNLVKAFKEQKINQLEEGTLFDRALKSIEDSSHSNGI